MLLQTVTLIISLQVRSLSPVRLVESVSQPRAHCRLISEFTGKKFILDPRKEIKV